MKAKAVFLAILFFISVLSASHIQEKKQPKDLPDNFRKWLEEEVIYIIAPEEKEVFLQLQTDRERRLFIEAFWKQRDPNANTVENEFKTEHYRRMNYANHWFGRETAGPGWRTDRGRIYIILGPPINTESYEGQKQLYSTQIWGYIGDPALGLPPQFDLVFYQRNGVGDYVLYSPYKDGPARLIPGYTGDPYDFGRAYDLLRQIEPNVARVSLSLIPGSREQFDASFPSLASDVLVAAKIPSSPHKKVETNYAEKYLKYKDIVEVEYSTNYIDNDSSVSVIQDKSGIFFVHYLIEPKKLSIEQYENKFYTTLEVSELVTDTVGKRIYQQTKSLPLEFNSSQLENIKSKLFSYQNMFPLIRGDYKFSLLLKNTASKEFTSIEKDIRIPEAVSLEMSPLILAYRIDINSKHKGKYKPFLIADTQIIPSPRNDFALGNDLYIFFQVYGIDKNLMENGYFEYSIYKEEEKTYSLEKRIKDYPDAPNFFEHIRLVDFSPALYKIQVSLLDENKNERFFARDHFYISHASSLPRPWVLSQVLSYADDSVYSNILGIQTLNRQQISEATVLLEKAYRKNPESLKFAQDYARALFLKKDFRRVKEILEPFRGDQINNHDLLVLLGKSCEGMEAWEEAIVYYREYLNHHGINLDILNSLGACYYKLGKINEALVAWEQSLEINPKQEEIQKKVDAMKKENEK